jgi:hypothetical protein
MSKNKPNNGDTILAFTEWLDEKGYSYLMFLAKDGITLEQFEESLMNY